MKRETPISYVIERLVKPGSVLEPHLASVTPRGLAQQVFDMVCMTYRDDDIVMRHGKEIVREFPDGCWARWSDGQAVRMKWPGEDSFWRDPVLLIWVALGVMALLLTLYGAVRTVLG